MNLSLLTSDFWSVVVGVLLLHSRLSGWYALAFALVLCGLVLYHAERRPPTVASHAADGAAPHGCFGGRTPPGEPLIRPLIDPASRHEEMAHTKGTLTATTRRQSPQGHAQGVALSCARNPAAEATPHPGGKGHPGFRPRESHGERLAPTARAVLSVPGLPARSA